ncbi:hypothetical protein EBB07_33525 [Paenibacillaceae bacterium]|nr:hypothetical protein EBB07_33525 [Paenibacillaceae bacterium]
MKCQEVIEYMQRQLDGDLDDQELEVLMQHTRQCPDCAAMYERLKRLSDDLENLPKVTPSYSLVDAIMPRLEQLEAADKVKEPEIQAPPAVPSRRRQPSAEKRRWRDRWSVRALGGAIAAGVVAGLFLITYNPSSLPNALEHALPSSNDVSSSSAEGNESATDSDASAFQVTEQSADAMNSETETDINHKAAVETEEAPAEAGDAPAGGSDGSGNSQFGVTITDNNKVNGGNNAPSADQPVKEQSKGTISSASPSGTDAGKESAEKHDNGDAGASDLPADVVDQSGGQISPQGTNSRSTHDAGEMTENSVSPDKSLQTKDGTANQSASDEPAVMESAVPQQGLGFMADDAYLSSTVAGVELLSPDGVYNAVFLFGELKIYDVNNGTLLFQSSTRAGSLGNFEWAKDGKSLSYEMVTEKPTDGGKQDTGNKTESKDEQVADGKQNTERYIVQIKDWTETKQ